MKNIQDCLDKGCMTLFAQEHRYGYGFCVALIDCGLLEMMDELTSGGDSSNPYGFAEWILRSNRLGCPVAYETSLLAALVDLEINVTGGFEMHRDRIDDFLLVIRQAQHNSTLYDYFDKREGI
jgi:hypothetical protein